MPSEKLKHTLNELLPKESIFDDENFNATKYINQIFPNQQSLEEKLGENIRKLKGRIKKTNDEILNAIRVQATTKNQSTSTANDVIEDSQLLINHLYEKIGEIRERASESEKMVEKITQDIKGLHVGKKNLTKTVNSLRKLYMLQTALDHLKLLAKKKQYGKAAQLLSAINSFMDYFEKFKGTQKKQGEIKKIKEIEREVKEIKSELERNIMDDFEKLSAQMKENQGNTDYIQLMHNSCLVAEQLTPKYSEKIIGRFIDKQLARYEMVFQHEVDLSTLKKRYAWCKRLLKEYKQKRYCEVFPENWEVPMKFVQAFCTKMKQIITEILNGQKNDQVEIDAQVLHKALLSTIAFEREMKQTFQENVFTISKSFEEYMDAYLKFEKNTMEEKMKQMIERETWDPQSRTNSGQDLFIYISESLRNCTAFSKGKTLFNLLNNVWKYNIHSYTNILIGKLPKVSSGSTSALSKLNLFSKQDAHPPPVLTETQLRTIFHIVKLADYCQEELDQTEEILERIIEDQYKEKVSFEDEKSQFYKVLKSSIESLVMNMLNAISTPLNQMLKLPWANYVSVGDQSDYVLGIVENLRPLVEEIGANLPSSHFQYFCDSFVIEFNHLYQNTVFKLKKISSWGAQQILLDITHLKKFMESMLNLGNVLRFDQEDVQAFQRKVQTRWNRLESIVKVLFSASEEVLVTTFCSLIPNGTKDEFSKILEMKGLESKSRKLALEEFDQKNGP